MIQNTFPTAMFTPRSESTFCFMNHFHVQRMDKVDIRGTHDMRGKSIQVVYKQNYIESPPGDVARFLSRPAASSA
jgi:hypothetical protein